MHAALYNVTIINVHCMSIFIALQAREKADKRTRYVQCSMKVIFTAYICVKSKLSEPRRQRKSFQYVLRDIFISTSQACCSVL